MLNAIRQLHKPVYFLVNNHVLQIKYAYILPALTIFDLQLFIMLQANLKPVLLGVLGTQEIIIILIIVLLLFGGRKIPELMRGLGKGIREFNDAKSNVTIEIEEGLKEKENKPL
ncbi:MAG: hypothetical protein NVSMB7_10830 [Chitinophagaceae bacterium]